MEASTVVIEVQYGDIVRRFNAQVVDLSLGGLTEKMFSLFNFAPDTKIMLTFTAGDGDSFALVDDDTLCDVLKQSPKPLRITVARCKQSCQNPNAGVPDHGHQKYRGPEVQPGVSKLDSCFMLDLGPNKLNVVVEPSTPFTKVWRIVNNGTVAWPQKTRLVWIGGPKLSDLLSFELEIPATGLAVGQELNGAVDLISPESPGWFTTYWRMASPSGQKFGQLVWVVTAVVERVERPASWGPIVETGGISKLDGCVIRDWDLTDSLVISPSTPFTKIWRVRNKGTDAWPQKTRLVWIDGEKLSNLLSVEVEIPATGLAVGQELDVAVDLISPRLPRHYISYWRLTSPSGQMFGQLLSVLIWVD